LGVILFRAMPLYHNSIPFARLPSISFVLCPILATEKRGHDSDLNEQVDVMRNIVNKHATLTDVIKFCLLVLFATNY
jgi:hypothetical protein